MKVAIAILIILGAIFGVYKTWEYWDTVNKDRDLRLAEANEAVSPSRIRGLDDRLERSLEQAQKEGPKIFKQWIDQNRPRIQDPRLAWIELDYILLISQSDPVEAKRLFHTVKTRVLKDLDETSPVYKRIQRLSKTYE